MRTLFCACLAAALFLALAGRASAGCTFGSLSDGGGYCRAAFFWTSGPSFSGSADQPVDWRVYSGASNPPSTLSLETTDYSFGGGSNASSQWYQSCIQNNSGATTNFYLCDSGP